MQPPRPRAVSKPTVRLTSAELLARPLLARPTSGFDGGTVREASAQRHEQDENATRSTTAASTRSFSNSPSSAHRPSTTPHHNSNMKVLSIVSLALAADQVAAHGYLSQPAAPFVSGINTKYNALITESIDPAFAGKKWDDNPVANTKMFTDSFASSAFKTLGAMLDTAVPDCGNTLLSGTRVDVSSLSSMKWQNDQEQQGFVSSHHVRDLASFVVIGC